MKSSPKPPLDENDSLFLPAIDLDGSDRGVTSVQEIMIGRNLTVLRKAKLEIVEPVASTHNSIGRVARDLAAGPRLRKLAVYHEKGSLSITEEDSNDVVPYMVHIGTRTEKRDVVFAMLCEILCRLPCTPKELASDDIVWLLNVSRKVAYDRDQTVVQVFDEPYIGKFIGTWIGSPDVPAGKRFAYQGLIHGLAPATKKKRAETWTSYIQVPIGCIEKSKKFDIPSGYKWNDAQPKKPKIHKQTIEDNDPEDVELAKKCAMFLVTQYDGYIGSKDNCSFNYIRALKSYRSDKATPIGGIHNFSHGPLGGRPIWYGPRKDLRKTATTRSFIESSGEAKKHVKGRIPSISLYSTSRKPWSLVFAAMLQEAEVSSDILKIWTKGAQQADEINSLLEAGQTEFHVSPCERPSGAHLHACCKCSKANGCIDVKYDYNEEDYICDSCLSNDTVNDQVGKGTGKTRTEMEQTLQKLMMEEESHWKSRSKRTARKRDQLTTKWMRSDLLPLKINPNDHFDERYHDGYFDSGDLSTKAPTVTDHKGYQMQIRRPTVDAIDPIHLEIVDGRPRTAYHTQHNLTVTSHSANMSVKNHPKANYLALGQFRSAANKEEYESAVAITRNLLVNHIESGFSSQHQRDRIDKDPPKMYDELKVKYRDGTRLQQISTSPMFLFKTSDRRRPKSAKAGSETYSFQHEGIDKTPNFTLVEAGVLKIAKTYGLDNDKDRLLWLRRDPYSGKDIPFFFNSYSVVPIWDVWAIFEFYSRRLKRLRHHCDRKYAEKYKKEGGIRPDFEVETLIFEHCHQYMRLVIANREKFATGPWKDKSPACDSWQFPFFPTVGMPCNVSFGKNTGGGTEMNHGFEVPFPRDEEVVVWSEDRTGIEVETQAKNFARWTYPTSHIDQIEVQFDNVRALKGNQIVKIFPYDKGPILLAEPVLFEEFEVDIAQAIANGDDGIDTNAEVANAVDDEIAYKDDSMNADIEAEVSGFNQISRSTAVQTLSIVATIHGRNIARAGNTCWLSSVIQVLHKVPGFRQMLLGDVMVVRESTGRTLDTDAVPKYKALIDALGGMLTEMESDGADPVSEDHVVNVVNAYNSLKKTPEGLSVSRDAAEFLEDLLDKIITAIDRSRLTNKPSLQELVDAQRLREAKEDPLLELQEDIEQFKEAWRDAGHDSGFAKLVNVQTVTEEPCEMCSTIRREFETSPFIQLRLDNPHSGPVSMASLRDAFLQESEPDKKHGKPCRSDNCGMRLRDKYRRITNSGDVLVICIARFYSNVADESFAQSIPMNQITGFQELDLAEWSHRPSLPSSDEKAKQSLVESKYEVAAIVQYVFSDTTPHYRTFVKDENRTTIWVLYDDMHVSPKVVDLDQELSEPETCISVLVYKRVEFAGIGDLPIDIMVREDPVDNLFESITSSHIFDLLDDVAMPDLEPEITVSTPVVQNQEAQDSTRLMQISDITEMVAELCRLRAQIAEIPDNALVISEIHRLHARLDMMDPKKIEEKTFASTFERHENEMKAQISSLALQKVTFENTMASQKAEFANTIRAKEELLQREREKFQREQADFRAKRADFEAQLRADQAKVSAHQTDICEREEKLAKEAKYYIPLNEIAIEANREMPVTPRISDILRYIQEIEHDHRTLLAVGKVFMLVFFSDAVDVPVHERLHVIGYFLQKTPMNSLLRFLIDSKVGGLQAVLEELVNIRGLTPILEALRQSFGYDTVLRDQLLNIDVVDAPKAGEVIYEYFTARLLNLQRRTAEKAKFDAPLLTAIVENPQKFANSERLQAIARDTGAGFPPDYIPPSIHQNVLRNRPSNASIVRQQVYHPGVQGNTIPIIRQEAPATSPKPNIPKAPKLASAFTTPVMSPVVPVPSSVSTTASPHDHKRKKKQEAPPEPFGGRETKLQKVPRSPSVSSLGRFAQPTESALSRQQSTADLVRRRTESGESDTASIRSGRRSPLKKFTDAFQSMGKDNSKARDHERDD